MSRFSVLLPGASRAKIVSLESRRIDSSQEYSIFSRYIEASVIPACLEVGATLVTYSPLGRGMLSGCFKQDLPGEGDYRATTPRFQGEAYRANIGLVDETEIIASARSCKPAQIALAWVLGRGEHVMTIPGTTRLKNLKTNLEAYDIELSGDEQATLDQLADRVMGDRYDERGMSIINGLKSRSSAKAVGSQAACRFFLRQHVGSGQRLTVLQESCETGLRIFRSLHASGR